MRFFHVRWALWLVRPLGLFSCLLAVAILAAYPAGIESLYRPLSGGPATHPLTAAAIAVLGLSVWRWRPYRQGGPWPALLALCALALGAGRLVEIAVGIDLLSPFTPFGDVLAANAAKGQPIATGANTAAMVVMFALAMLLNQRQRASSAQIVAFLALGIPLVSITGYAYGFEKFYGRMALTTVIAALPAGCAILIANAHRGMLRAVLSPWIGGRIARVQLALGYVVPFLIGYALPAVSGYRPEELFGVFVVLVSAFVSALVTFSALVQENVDKLRRAAERRLTLVATLDPLTGVPNRRLLMDYASREWERAQRSGGAFALLMLDIDHFKRINDTYGHASGDNVLRRVAEVMRSSLRSQDMVARFGGEEFVVVLPGTDLSGALLIAEKLRQRIEAERIDDSSAAMLAVTASIGCAGSSNAYVLQDLLASADAALYHAKSSGRNRVCSEDDVAAGSASVKAA